MKNAVVKGVDKSSAAANAGQNAWARMAGFFGDPTRTTPWLVGAIVAALVTLIVLVYLLVSVPRDNTMIRNVAEMRVLSQQIAKNASEAARGSNQAAFQSLEANQKRFKELLDSVHSLYGATPSLDKSWADINKHTNLILANRKTVQELNGLALNIAEVVPDMQAEYNAVVDGMVREGAPSSQVALAKNQVLLSERILRSINTVLNGDESSVSSADDFSSDADDFGRVLDGQLSGDNSLGLERVNSAELRASLESVKQTYEDSIKNAAARILVSSPQVYQVRSSASALLKTSVDMLNQLTTLSEDVARKTRNVGSTIVLLLALGGLVWSLFKLFQMRATLDQERMLADADRKRVEAEAESKRAQLLEEESERNQTAILRLLDELGDLADGDLTVNATVSEDFTGAIADSVNYAIDQLRQLVSAINTTALQVAESSQETQATTMQLAEASEHQAQEIAGASAAINEMAVSIDQVSANAMESAAVAERSVAIAYNGGEVVQRSIEGMNTIREQIQETSKRIKRLGESSQEIGDIVSLINDIADQTNILALNAAIQASMAGEAGRGFAVVADEVQRLAERSTAATKQIEGLVRTIQTDTNEAVISMEQTTSEVVRGAKLAKDAGVALEEIQEVSRSLADLIQNISNAARQQAASAGHISNTMNIIQEITTQTTAGTIATARSVGNLADMAANLRESVSGFKLPEGNQA